MSFLICYIVIGCIIAANEVRLSINENMKEIGALIFIFVCMAVLWLPLFLWSFSKYAADRIVTAISNRNKSR